MKIRNARLLISIFWIIYIAVQYYNLPVRVTILDKILIVLYAFIIHYSLCHFLLTWVWNRTIDSGKPKRYLIYGLLLGAVSTFIILVPLFYFFGHYNILFISAYNYWTLSIWTLAAYMSILTTASIKMLDRLSIYNFLGLNSENAKLAELDAISAQGNKSLILSHMNEILSQATGNEEEAISRMRKHIKMISHLYTDTSEEQLLTKEIQFLVDYNELCIQKDAELKYRVNFDFDGDIEVKRIIPLVLFPFYEKAMYYVGIKPEESQIKSLVYGESKFIRFQIFADIPPLLQIDRSKMNGLNTRITSAKRRLMEAYPDSHELIVNENERHYNVFLRIDVQ